MFVGVRVLVDLEAVVPDGEVVVRPDLGFGAARDFQMGAREAVGEVGVNLVREVVELVDAVGFADESLPKLSSTRARQAQLLPPAKRVRARWKGTRPARPPIPRRPPPG